MRSTFSASLSEILNSKIWLSVLPQKTVQHDCKKNVYLDEKHHNKLKRILNQEGI